jgi:hypothetical protein
MPRTEFGFNRNACTCQHCVLNCQFIPGYLIPDDLGRMIPPEADPETWAREHLRASPGAKILRINNATGERQVIQIGTLVPAHITGGMACHWLKNGRCEIHENAPFGCAFFYCGQNQQQSDIISAPGLGAIMEAHKTGELYSRLWQLLWDENLRAPGPDEKRAAMAVELRRRRPSSPLLQPRRRY